MAGGGGGAWKVAYADFVTAMMALFMVLWISSQDKKILIATSKYFQSPFKSPLEDHSGIMPFNKQSNSSTSSDSDNPKPGEGGVNKQIQLSFLNSVAADFSRLLNLDKNPTEKPMDIQITSDGLRITLFDRSKRPLFVGNTVQFTESGKFLIQNLAWLIDRHHFRVTIDGHTRANLKMPDALYSSWELSSDRANAARRDLVRYAVDPTLIERVTGYADTHPLQGESADSEANQRITLSLTLTSKPAAPRVRGDEVAAIPAPAPTTSHP
jgi:chemotaxis protein MotB